MEVSEIKQLSRVKEFQPRKIDKQEFSFPGGIPMEYTGEEPNFSIPVRVPQAPPPGSSAALYNAYLRAMEEYTAV